MPRTLARLTGRNVPGTGRTASASRPDFGSRRTIPEEPYLYGITNSHAIYTPTVPRGITRIDLVTQEISEVIQFHDDEDFHLAANIPGTNILCGIREKDGSSFIDGYDLCMHYWCNPVERNAITICSDFNNTVSLEMAGDKLLTYCSISYPVYTRLNMPPIHTPEIPLPDGLKPESLSRYPGVIADVHMLLSANNGDDTFSPVVIDIAKEKMHCYDPIKAEALIPFRLWNHPRKTQTACNAKEAISFPVPMVEIRNSAYGILLPET